MARLMTADDYRHIRPAAPTRPLLFTDKRIDPEPSPVSSILDLPYVTWFGNGRSAIAHAAMMAGVTTNCRVLAPAYHCESMVAPLAWLGASIGLYRIKADMSIDMDHLLSVADDRTRLVLLPQYFGHRRSTKELFVIAKQRGWTLIEDCAHAFLTIGDANLLGVDCDFMVASAPKFFAAFDGGVLASRIPRSDWPSSNRPSIGAELRAWTEAFEYAMDYGRLPRLARIVVPALGELRRLRRRSVRRSSPSTRQPASRYGGVDFEAENVNVGATLLARMLASRSNRATVAAARRRNWRELRERLGAHPDLRFPVDRLDASDVPYVLAVEIPDPDRTFPELKRRGVPVYRWENCFPGCDDGVCAVSRRFRSTLIQLPCHQSLTQQERDWVANIVLDTVSHS